MVEKHLNVDDTENIIMNESTDVNAFVRKFTNNCVSDADLRVMATSEWASVLATLPPKMIWLGEILMMSDETFSVTSFMYANLTKFAELVTLGSLNDIRQIIKTTRIRASAQAAIMEADKFSDMLPHPGMHLMEDWNPGASTLKRLKRLLVSRVEAYILTIKEADSVNNASHYELSRCYKDSCPDECTHKHMRKNDFWYQTVGTSKIDPKSWQPKMGIL